METPTEQVQVLIWRSQGLDTRSVDKYGHVELAVNGVWYGFFPDLRRNPSQLSIGRGCHAVLLGRPSVIVAVYYLDKVAQEKGDDIYLDRDGFPVVWSFGFAASPRNMEPLMAFLKQTQANPPLYALVPRKQGAHNCQTITLAALSSAGLLGGLREPHLKPSPDALYDWLSEKLGQSASTSLVSKQMLRLHPPQWVPDPSQKTI